MKSTKYYYSVIFGLIFSCAIVIVATLITLAFKIPSFGKTICNLTIVNGKISFSGGYPFSIQALTFFAFGIACALIWFRNKETNEEAKVLEAGLLPEDERTLVQPADIADIRKKMMPFKNSILNTLIERALLQYQTTSSTSETAAIVNSTADVFYNRMESEYAIIRYLAWAIPSLGFVGTVMGIGKALSGFGSIDDLPMDYITGNLSTAFDTTFIALILSLILMFLIHVAQAKEETVINSAHNYCISNLINRIFNPEQLTK